MEEDKPDSILLFKIALVGCSKVGKTSLICKYAKDKYTFPEEVSLISCSYLNKRIEKEDDKIDLQIWETHKYDAYNIARPLYFRIVVGVIVVYDVTSDASFKEVDYIVECIKRSARANCVSILCANKIDLVKEKTVTTEDGLRKAEEHNMLFFETSVNEGINVNEMFEGMTNEIYDRFKNEQLDTNTAQRLLSPITNYPTQTNNSVCSS